jgi:AraC-like DNA-binding protein
MLLVRALATAVERAGVERGQYLAEAGIDALQLEDMHARISLDQHRRAVRAAYRLTGDPAFGLHLGERLSVSSFDVLGHLAEQSGSLRDALLTAVRYSGFVSQGPRIELEERDERATLRFILPEENTPESRLASEFANVAMLRLMRMFAGEAQLPLRVLFTHPKPRHHAEYRRYFAGTECFSQPITGIEVPRVWLDKSAHTRASELHEYLLPRAEYLLAKANRDATATDRVSRWIDSQTELQRPTLGQVARELGTSARSLRRRLQQEQTQFSMLVDGARATHAKRMLQDPRAGIQDTAYALGFRTPSAFSRAFKRWTGMGPKAYRKAHVRVIAD